MEEATRNRRRIALMEPVRASFVAGRSEGKGVVYNVSMGGFFVRSPLLPREGTRVSASLMTASGWRISVRGVVRWNTMDTATRPGLSGFGVHLTHPSHDYRGFVDGALAATPLSIEPGDA